MSQSSSSSALLLQHGDKSLTSEPGDAEAHQSTHREQLGPGGGSNVLTLSLQVRGRLREMPTSSLEEVKLQEERLQTTVGLILHRQKPLQKKTAFPAEAALLRHNSTAISDSWCKSVSHPHESLLSVILPNYFDKTRASDDLQTSQNTGFYHSGA